MHERVVGPHISQAEVHREALPSAWEWTCARQGDACWDWRMQLLFVWTVVVTVGAMAPLTVKAGTLAAGAGGCRRRALAKPSEKSYS
jgi:hypothetical protein